MAGIGDPTIGTPIAIWVGIIELFSELSSSLT
jgi:hypothetical protein